MIVIIFPVFIKNMTNKIDFTKPQTYAMMVGVSLPEQIVMAIMAPDMPFLQRLMVSVVMFISHFSLNGFVKRAPTLADEYKWIIPTALYGAYVTGNPTVGIALFIADTMMTVTLRG